MEIPAAAEAPGLLMCSKPWKCLRVAMGELGLLPPKRGVGNDSPAEVHGHRMGNKQEQLGAPVQMEKYGTVDMRET